MKIKELVDYLNLFDDNTIVIISDTDGESLELAHSVTKETVYTDNLELMEPLSLSSPGFHSPTSIEAAVIWRP
jgi:hypothetical protein